MRKKGIESKKEFNRLIAKSAENDREFNKIISGVPSTYHKLLYIHFFRKTLRERSLKLTLNRAAKLKCLDCSNFQKEEVINCAVPECPLFDFRPHKK